MELHKEMEELTIDRTNLNNFNQNNKIIKKKHLDNMMCDYICTHNIDNNEDLNLLRSFIKFLKTQ